jgi:hypothetical protein
MDDLRCAARAGGTAVSRAESAIGNYGLGVWSDAV